MQQAGYKPKTGVILANIGTPDEPTKKAVKHYLKRFLMNKRIAPMNRAAWWFVLHLGILPRRGKTSAERYRLIWTEGGSPLKDAQEKLAGGLEDAYRQSGGLDVVVSSGMCFGEPSFESVFSDLRHSDCDQVIVLPLFPQSACATTGIVFDKIEETLDKMSWDVPCQMIDNYHDNETYIRALAASARRAGFNPQLGDKLLLSFHSLPLADIERGDTYELQCKNTLHLLAAQMGLEPGQVAISFQSRFDKERNWLGPSTYEKLAEFAQPGNGRTFLMCPGFSVECLETLYDVEHLMRPFYEQESRDAQAYRPHGGFVYIPCLDRTKAHVTVLTEVLRPYTEGA